MTCFEDAVVEVLLRLEPGEVATYGEIAAEAGFPGAARAVGNLLRHSDEALPWWRVVGAGGWLISPDPARQAKLLAEEGIAVSNRRVTG